LFAQPDSIIPNVYDPQNLNRYSFERNNPLISRDDTGHFVFIDDIIEIYIGSILVAYVLCIGAQLIVIAADNIPPEKIDAIRQGVEDYLKLKSASNTISDALNTVKQGWDVIKTGGSDAQENKEFLSALGGLAVDFGVQKGLTTISTGSVGNYYGSSNELGFPSPGYSLVNYILNTFYPTTEIGTNEANGLSNSHTQGTSSGNSSGRGWSWEEYTKDNPGSTAVDAANAYLAWQTNHG
jgi:hypothetical protein